MAPLQRASWSRSNIVPSYNIYRGPVIACIVAPLHRGFVVPARVSWHDCSVEGGAVVKCVVAPLWQASWHRLRRGAGAVEACIMLRLRRASPRRYNILTQAKRISGPRFGMHRASWRYSMNRGTPVAYKFLVPLQSCKN